MLGIGFKLRLKRIISLSDMQSGEVGGERFSSHEAAGENGFSLAGFLGARGVVNLLLSGLSGRVAATQRCKWRRRR